MARYTAIPLPLTRFVPGASFSGPRPAHGAALSPDWPGDALRWRESRDYLLGVDLFNAGFTWESHEALETPWKQLRGAGDIRGAAWVQSIIQVAAARLKREIGNRPGVARLRTRAAANMARVLPASGPMMGADAARWWSACGAWFDDVECPPPWVVLDAM